MNKIMSILSNPLKRCGLGFLMILVCGPLGALVFPPLVIFVFVGVFLFLMLGEREKPLWFETTMTEECEYCHAVCDMKAVRVKHYMYMFMPVPFFNILFGLIQIPYRTTYYVVCAECLQKHVGKNDFAAIQVIAQGGLATMREITKEEFEKRIKREN